MLPNRVSLPRQNRAGGALCCGAGRTAYRFAAGLLAGVSLVALTAPAAAVDATWVGGQQPAPAEWTQGTNWLSTPAHTLPDGTAFFTNNGAPSSVTINGAVSLGEMQFGAGASAYQFKVGPGGLALTGAGIVVQSASAPTFDVQFTSQLQFFNGSTAGAATIANAGSVIFNDSSSAGSAQIVNQTFAALTTFAGFSSAHLATIDNGGGVVFLQSSSASAATINVRQGATLSFQDLSDSGQATINIGDGAKVVFLDHSVGDSARFIFTGTGVLDFSGTSGTNGTGVVAGGSFEGTGGIIDLGANQVVVGNNDLSTAYAGSISDCDSSNSSPCVHGAAGGSLTKVGNGTFTLSGINTYTGTTEVDGGALIVNGSIASSKLTTVDAGGTLGGNGIVGNTFVNGGTLAPGSANGTLTVQGNLTFTAASTYMIEVSPSSAARTNVTGTATLGGATLGANFAPGAYVQRQYTIVNAGGGVTGSFGAQVNTNLPAGFVSSVSYDANNAFLNLNLDLGPKSGPGGNANQGSNVNQRSVAAALRNSFNAAGGIPMVFGALSAAGLTQVSGEFATGAQQTTFNAMNLFVGVLTDPAVAGRGDPATGTGAALSYADGKSGSRSASERQAYAMISKAVPPARSFAPSWSVWAAGYGGAQTTDGNATLGSHDATSRVFGTVVGADYRLAPDTLAGFALAGGGTSFGIADGLGGGRSDLFQTGVFVRHADRAAYITAALAYGWQQLDTDRTVAVAGLDELHARYNANAFSGRAEAGNRLAMAGIGVTPYAAAQFTSFDLPAYAESVRSGASTFALRYDAKDVTATRSELGLRTDTSFVLVDAVFTMRGRAAWAHDFNSDRSIAATFQTLPVSSFIVGGAAQARNVALTSASAELTWLNGISLGATFEGEFSDVTRSFAGKAIAHYQW